MAGDRRALARLLTAIENRTAAAEAALRRLYPMAGRAHLVGITGPPGSGKSTLVAALIAEVRRAGRPVAVVAVDPSSPITGGAILGDRVRMQAYAADRDVFIRSMAARGHAGGLASTTGAACAVLDAVGFDLILIETVGTGQSEVEVASSADTTVVLEAPEMGDEVQAIKAGLLEVADIVVVNKGDRPGAARTAAQLRAMLVATPVAGVADPAAPDRPRPKRPEVMVTTAATGEGVPELLAALDRHRSVTARRADDGAGDGVRLARADAQVRAILADRIADRLRTGPLAGEADATLRAVADHELDPFAAADRLLAAIGREGEREHRAGLRRGRRADGPRDRPGPRRDRQAGQPVRAGPRPGRGRSRPDRRQPRPGRGQGSPRAGGARRDAGPDRPDRRPRGRRRRRSRHRGGVRGPRGQDRPLARARRAGPGGRDLRLEHELDLDRPAGRSGPAPARRARFAGMHFFSPVPVMPLIELIRGSATDDATEAAIRALAAELGKQVIVSADRPGFLVNRILMPFLAEAMRAYEEGVGTADDIDTGARVGLNHPMGPLELADFIGLDVCLGIMRVLHDGLGAEQFRPPAVLEELVAAGHLGQKTGRGFYTYPR